jgi:acyl carrier protein
MTTNRDESHVIAEVAEIIRRIAKVRPEVPIRAETRLVDDLAIDSLDLVAIVLGIQEDFDVVIDEDAVQHLSCVGDLADQVGVRAPSVTD